MKHTVSNPETDANRDQGVNWQWSTGAIRVHRQFAPIRSLKEITEQPASVGKREGSYMTCQRVPDAPKRNGNQDTLEDVLEMYSNTVYILESVHIINSSLSELERLSTPV